MYKRLDDNKHLFLLLQIWRLLTTKKTSKKHMFKINWKTKMIFWNELGKMVDLKENKERWWFFFVFFRTPWTRFNISNHSEQRKYYNKSRWTRDVWKWVLLRSVVDFGRAKYECGIEEGCWFFATIVSISYLQLLLFDLSRIRLLLLLAFCSINVLSVGQSGSECIFFQPLLSILENKIKIMFVIFVSKQLFHLIYFKKRSSFSN